MITLIDIERDLEHRGLWLSWTSQAELNHHPIIHTWTANIQHKNKVLCSARGRTLNEAKRAAYTELVKKG